MKCDSPLGTRVGRRSWLHKFACAFRGLKTGIRGHSSFAVHFFAAAIVVSLAMVLGCNLTEWAVLVGCVGAVMVSELFNSAVEEMVRCHPENERQRYWPALDVAAGAVLAASFFVMVVGSLILGNRVMALWLASSSYQ
ncbi:MAG: diacylglycerol kinase family protein [Planctomycetota bacterium]